MSKVKYYYDSETLSYRKIEKKKGRRLGIFLLSLAGMMLSGFLLLLVYINLPYVETPKEKTLKRELSNMELQFQILNKKMSEAEAVLAEVRAARKAMCDRFGNDPRRLLAHLRAEQRNYRGRVIKSWSEVEPAVALRETPAAKKKE
jgi:hypothetical protein